MMTESPTGVRVRRVHPARNARVITGTLSAMALMGMVSGFQISATAPTADPTAPAAVAPTPLAPAPVNGTSGGSGG